MKRESWTITSRGEWLDRRRGLLTASRIAALFDAHPFLTREQLAGTMTGHHNEGDNAAMKRGRILEPAILEAMREEHPTWQIEKANEFWWLPEHRIGATPDAWFATQDGEYGLIQCKTVAPEVWQGRPSLAYQLQTLTEMMCAGVEHGRLAVMVTSRSLPLYEFEVPRHALAEDKLLAAAAAWWREWDAGRIAPAAPAEALEGLLDDGSVVDLSTDNMLAAILSERAMLKGTTSSAERRLKQIDDEIKTKIGSARMAFLPGWEITYTTQHRKETIIPEKDIRVLRVKSVEEAM